jgi:hypothetical protein
MDVQNKKSVITWSSYASILVAFISAWAGGALSAIDAYGPYWGLTLLQVIFVPMVGIGIGLAISEGVARVAPGASISEYVEEATGEVEKFLQSGIGTSEDTAKRITGRWKAKAGEAIQKVTSSVSRAIHRGNRDVRQVTASLVPSAGATAYPTPNQVLVEFWQVAHAALAPSKGVTKAKAMAVLAGRATEVTLHPVQEYDPTHAEPRLAYLKRRTRAMLFFAILVAAGLAIAAILKVVVG